MSALQKSWYRPVSWSWLLLPFTLLFWLLSSVRRLAYQAGWLKTHRLPVPVIVIGNISVGGNGKTPLVVRLAQLLKQQGYHVGVITRGYGGKGGAYPLSVDGKGDPLQLGDEPVMMRQHLSCPIVVDPDRVRGARFLVEKHKCDLILSDDGLQHYRLQRDLEIAVVDGIRRLGNGLLLPAGPLREGAWRLKTVDFVVVNGGSARLGEHLMSLEAGRLTNVKYPNQTKSVSELHKAVVAVAGIGNPQRFFDSLAAKQVKIKQRLAFADHHRFRASDIPPETVLMTEKDAVKCRAFADAQWWYLPVSAKLTEQFIQQFLQRLRGLRKRANGEK